MANRYHIFPSYKYHPKIMSVIVSDETWYVDAWYDYKHCFDLPLCVAHESLKRILHFELFSYFDSCQTTSGKQL